MKYQWLEQQETCDELSQEIRKGIEIELENETPEILQKLDRRFQGLRRERGKTLAEAPADLEPVVAVEEKRNSTKTYWFGDESYSIGRLD